MIMLLNQLEEILAEQANPFQLKKLPPYKDWFGTEGWNVKIILSDGTEILTRYRNYLVLKERISK